MINELSVLGVDGSNQAIHAAGAGDRVVLLHGFPLDYRMWLPQLEGLADVCHMLAPDFRGFGGSSLHCSAYQLADLAADVERMRQHLAGQERIVLVGLSMRGYVALEYWRQFRQHVRGLVLISTKPYVDSEEARAKRLAMAEAVEHGDVWESIQAMQGVLLGNSADRCQPMAIELTQKMMRSANGQAIAEAQRAMANRQDHSEALVGIDVPTLVITGECDTLAPPDQSALWARQIPDSEFMVIPDAGHLAPIQKPGEFNAALRAFLRSL